MKMWQARSKYQRHMHIKNFWQQRARRNCSWRLWHRTTTGSNNAEVTIYTS